MKIKLTWEETIQRTAEVEAKGIYEAMHNFMMGEYDLPALDDSYEINADTINAEEIDLDNDS